jgi:hypothetical protein
MTIHFWWSRTGLIVYRRERMDYGGYRNTTIVGIHFWPPRCWHPKRFI